MQLESFNKLIRVGLLTCSLGLEVACTKSVAINCNDEIIQSQITQYVGLLINNQFITPKIITIKSLTSNLDDKKSCSTEIEYHHQIFQITNLKQKYQYLVNNELQITKFITTTTQINQLKKWSAQQATISDWEKTDTGILAVIQTPRNGDNLIFNHQKIKFPGKMTLTNITILQKFQIESQDIFLLAVNPIGTQDNDLPRNYFLSIIQSGKPRLSQGFDYKNNSARADESGISFNGINQLSFAEVNDLPSYRYTKNKLIKVSNSKPLAYYQKKFAKYTSVQILKQIKNDGCLNGDQFYLSDICSYKINSYCFEYHSITNPLKDKSFWLLNNMCQIQQY